MLTKKQAGFSKVLVLIIILAVIAGGVLAWQYWPEGAVEEEQPSNGVIQEVTEGQRPITETMEVKIYLQKQRSENVDCVCNDIVTRVVPKTQAVARVAIEELIKGPSEEEKRYGYDACLPTKDTIERYKEVVGIGAEWGDKIKINKVETKGGVIYIDFSEEINAYGGGSCWIESIRSSIVNTLMQFSTINDVVISIEGETELILQP